MSETASATYTSVPSGPDFQYSITLNDTGSTQIGTLWFAWDDVPDQNFMTSDPTGITSPAGWSAVVTHFPGTGFGIQWVAGTGAALTAGQTLTGFSFISPDTPTMLAGPSQFDSAFQTTSSFVYQGAPLGDPGFNFVVQAACFRAGTRIRTSRGDVRVEELGEGDEVLTFDGSYRAVEWIGHRSIDCDRHPSPWQVWPVRIGRGAFAPGIPARDLDLSPDHAVLADDVLIPAKFLVNGKTIVQVPVDEVSYFHVALDRHDVLFAEALPVESYLDTGLALFGESGVVAQYADMTVRVWEAEGCAPLVMAGLRLATIRGNLAARAMAHDANAVAASE